MEKLVFKQSYGIEKKSINGLALNFLVLLSSLICIGDLFNISNLSYIDDIIGFAGLLFLLTCVLKGKFLKETFTLIVIFCIGFISALITDHSRNSLLVIGDFFFVYKFVFTFFLIYEISKNKWISIQFVKKYSLFSLILIFIMFPVCLVQKMFGLERASFFSYYPGTIGFYSFLFFVIHFFILTNKHINKKYLFIFAFAAIFDIVTCFLSKSTTAEFFIIFFCLFYLFSKYKKSRIIICAIIAICISLFAFVFKDKIIGYFFNSDAPRNQLYYYSFYFFKQRFPFGLGFSFFGGKIAANYYSPIYDLLGWRETYILGENSGFLLDTYYTAIIGETGFAGSILFIYIIFRMFRLIKKRKANGCYYFSGFILFCLFLTGVPFNFINSGIGISYIFVLLFLSNCGKIKS